MTPIVGLIAQGEMGSGLGRRLVERGLKVWTVLEGRSEPSAARAAAAGMTAVPKSDMAKVDIFLSVAPPAEANALAAWLSPVLTSATAKPVYADLNAVSPATAEIVAATVAPTGCAFADGGIIGTPPTPDGKGPSIYVSGPGAARLDVLRDYGLDIRVMNGPVGAASAVKLSFAGITKGFTAMASMMVLAAARHGTADDLKAELASRCPGLLGFFQPVVARMYDKAYRFGPELLEISEFVADDKAASEAYRAFADFYDRIAVDHRGSQVEVNQLKAFTAK